MSIFGPGMTGREEGGHERKSDGLRLYAKKSYVDTSVGNRLNRGGDYMTGDLNMRKNLIRGLSMDYPPVYTGDEAASWMQILGLLETAFSNVRDPADPHDATSKAYVDGKNSRRVLKDGDTMHGNLSLGRNRLTNLGDPAGPQDGATKAYVDSAYTAYASVNRPFFLKLRCGEKQESTTREFTIPNNHQRFGVKTRRLFIQFSIGQSLGEPPSCSLAHVRLNENFLTLRFTLSGPYYGKITLFATVVVLDAGVVELVEHTTN